MTNKRHDYIPANHAEFRLFVQNILDYVDGKINVDPQIWTHIPSGRFETLLALFKVFETAFDNAEHIPTPANVTARNDAQADVTHELRNFVNQFLRFPPVTNADRVSINIPNHDSIRTPVPIPETVPEIEADSAVIRVVGIRMRDHGSKSWAKPEHVHSIDLRWGIADGRPSHVDELPNIVSATANPITLRFEELERGKRVFYAGRWVNSKAECGPWSDIESAIIP